jgi:hypothetical protein
MLFAALIILCTLFLYGAVYFKYRPSPPPPKNQYNLSDRREIRCSSCNYDLRGSLHSCICPECGTPFEVYAKMRHPQ